MPKYVMWLPTWASVKVILEVDEPIEDEEERKQRVIDEGESIAAHSLCHYCARFVEISDQLDTADLKLEDNEVTEEDDE